MNPTRRTVLLNLLASASAFGMGALPGRASETPATHSVGGSGENFPAPKGRLIGGIGDTGEWESVGKHRLTLEDAVSPGLHMVRFGQAEARTPALTRKSFPGFDMQEAGAVAFLTDLGEDYDKQSYDSVSMQVVLDSAGSIYTIASKTRLATDTGGRISKRTGRFWTSGFPTQPAVLAAGVGKHQFRIASTLQPGHRSGDISLGRVFSGVGGTGGVLFRFDDAKVEAYTVFYPVMKPLGLVGELFIPVKRVGKRGCLSWSQIAELAANGWSVQVNGTGDDVAMQTRESVAACISELNSQADALVSRGLPRPIATCYPFGQKSSNGVQVNVAVSTSHDRVTVSSTLGIREGMRFICFGAPPSARVESVAARTVTLTEPVDTDIRNVEGRFVDDSGPFHGAKLQKALIEAGWNWAWATTPGSLFLQFGIENDDIVQANCNTWKKDQSFEDFSKRVALGLAAKSVVGWYIHAEAGPDMVPIMEWTAAEIQAGRAFCATTPLLENTFRHARPPAAS